MKELHGWRRRVRGWVPVAILLLVLAWIAFIAILIAAGPEASSADPTG